VCQSESQSKVCTAINNQHAKACQSMIAKTTINQSILVKLFNWVLSSSYQKSQPLFLIISSRPSLRFCKMTFSSLKKRFLSRSWKNHDATVVMHATMVVHHKHESSFASSANDVMPLYTVAGTTRLRQAKHGMAQRKYGTPHFSYSKLCRKKFHMNSSFWPVPGSYLNADTFHCSSSLFLAFIMTKFSTINLQSSTLAKAKMTVKIVPKKVYYHYDRTISSNVWFLTMPAWLMAHPLVFF